MRRDRSSGSYFFTRKLSRASIEQTLLNEVNTKQYSTDDVIRCGSTVHNILLTYTASEASDEPS